MSAPTTHDPLVVNTKDGVTWLRRTVTSDGHGLYAVTDSCKCPEYLMATLAELAEHGIAGSADVLPVPAGPEPQTYGPVFPWAALMDDEDLHDFLDELAASAITHASNAKALSEVEATCGRWRLIAEAQHAHNTAPGPDAEADGIARRIVPVQALREDETPGVPCSKCGDPVDWVTSTNSDGGYWRHRVIPGRVLDHFGMVAGVEGPHRFEREYQGVSDAKRRLPRCKHCGHDHGAPMHVEAGGR